MNDKLFQSSMSYREGWDAADNCIKTVGLTAACAIANLPGVRLNPKGTKGERRYTRGFHDRLAKKAAKMKVKLVYNQWNGVSLCRRNGKTGKSRKGSKKK